MNATQGPVTAKLHPDWVTGFVDAEGSFMINVFIFFFTKSGAPLCGSAASLRGSALS
jgi:hypothetical protein